MTSAVSVTAEVFVRRLATAAASAGQHSVVVESPGTGPGHWAGAPCVVVDGADVVLAYRMRRPEGQGRGLANFLAVSVAGGPFEVVAEIGKFRFGAESLERPWLVRMPGGWRLYVSCATPGTRHWHVVAVEAATLEGLRSADPVQIWPGGDDVAVKDPVIAVRDDGWHAWVCCHPLDDPDATDRMYTRYATSADGLEWTWGGIALDAVPDGWDARGARAADVIETTDGFLMLYDGRVDAAENFEERTGAAFATTLSGPYSRLASGPAAQSGQGRRGLRYLSVAGAEVFAEYTKADGGHDLRRLLL